MMAFGGATEAQLYRMVELINLDRILDVTILIGPKIVFRSPESEECR